MCPDGTLEEKKAAGTALQEAFFRANPRLKELIKNVKKASRRGWLKGLDGRRIQMRKQHGRVMEHKALNTLLQCAGAVIMTQARVWLNEELDKRGLLNTKVWKVLDYHDEETYECDLEVVEELKELMVTSVVVAGEKLKLRCPLDAEAKVGKTWAEVH